MKLMITEEEADTLRAEIARRVLEIPTRALIDLVGADPSDGKVFHCDVWIGNDVDRCDLSIAVVHAEHMPALVGAISVALTPGSAAEAGAN